MKKIVSVFVLLSFCIFGIYAQTADEIISKYHQSMGGLDKFKAHTSTKAIGTAPTPQGDFPFEFYQEKPNKIKVVMDIMGKKFVAQAYDGQTAWMLNPFVGDTALRLSDEQAKAVMEEAEFEDPFIDYAAKGHEVILEGTEDVQGVPCYKINLTKYKGNTEKENTQYYYLDKETCIPIMTKTFVKAGPQAGQVMETYFSDYKEVGDGLMMPFSFEVKSAGQIIQILTFEKIILNEDIPDEEFEFPGEAK
ncbi:MAG: outer membrane lipoprotein-sorting protein [Bacteroidales bacterium]|nr:outer membrane lipoprotein-sorting protein [Bacteroidales bacterium]